MAFWAEVTCVRPSGYARCSRSKSRVSAHPIGHHVDETVSASARDFRARGNVMVYPRWADKGGLPLTTTDNSPEPSTARNVSARNSAGPILDAFDAIAAEGGDPK